MLRSRLATIIAVTFGCSAGAVTAARGDVLSGTVTTRARGGVTPATAVVYVEPLAGAAPAAPSRPFTIAQKNKAFLPRVIGVPVGATVQFPNEDQIFHNVFSLSPGNTFDLGLYRAGSTKSRTIAAAGAVRVFCNIHPQMTALVVAAPTPWIAALAADGAWRFDVPAGRYRITALSERAAAVTAEITVAGATTAPPMALDESGFVAAPHLNKFGRPYPDAAYKQQ